MKRLSEPRRVDVRVASNGRPEAVGTHSIRAVRESWLVEDRWWTDAPLRRRYWEVVTADGKNLVIYRDLIAGTWCRQRSS